MPDQNFKNITYDRKVIRAGIKPMSFNEARRLKGPIYDAIIKELYEEGCNIGACHLQFLVNMERKFVEQKTIRNQVSEDPELLSALIDNIKMAEKASKLLQHGGWKATFQLLYQCINMLSSPENCVRFDWLLVEVFDIIARTCDKFGKCENDSTNELIARIYYKYGGFLSTKGDHLNKAIKFFEKSLILSRDQLWLVDSELTDEEFGVYPTLHLMSGRKLSAALLRNATLKHNKSEKIAVELAHRAIIVLAEIGISKNKLQFYRANLIRAQLEVHVDNFEEALNYLIKIENEICGEGDIDFIKLRCEIYLEEGLCIINLKNGRKAITKLRLALKISRKYKFRAIEGEVLLMLGKMFACNHYELDMAKKAFELAKAIFVELGDMENEKKTHYLLAKIKADEIFPYFMDMLKMTSNQYCEFYNLRLWKNNCKPFWTNMCTNLEKEQKEPIYCLLEAESISSKISSLLDTNVSLHSKLSN